MTDAALELDRLRRRISALVAADGDEAHQVAIDRLVWAHAHQQAAVAVRAWADETGHPLIAELAAAAEDQAQAFIFGCTAEDDIEASRRLAALAQRLAPVEDLGMSDDHRLLRATLREFANREIRPLAADIHRRDLDVPESIIQRSAELGLFGLSVPTTYGGTQEHEDVTAMLIATEELSRASLAAGGSLITRPEILVRALLKGGTPEQKQRWLPQIASGERLVAVGVTEPDFGSDVAALTCRATQETDGRWRLDGTKLWCTFAGRSELLMLLCRTAEGGHRGLSVFVLEKPRQEGHGFEFAQPDGGVMRGTAIPTIGYRGMHTYEISFEGYRLPADSLVGGDEWLNRGFYLQMEGFAMGRIQTAGRAVGVMQAALEEALEYCRDRRVFGQPVFGFQLARAKLGLMAVRVHAGRRLSYQAARLLDAGSGQVEASLAKLYASRMAELVTREAMQLHGAMGYGEETNVSRYFVDARVLAIFEGAEEVLSQRVVGRALLREPTATPLLRG